VLIKFLYTIVAGVRDVQIALAVVGDGMRPPHLSRTIPLFAEGSEETKPQRILHNGR